MNSRTSNANMHKVWGFDLNSSGIREFRGPARRFLSLVAIAFSFFHLYTAAFGTIYITFQRAVHLGFALFLIFAFYPFSKKNEGYLSLIIDAGLMILSVMVNAYLIWDFEGIFNRLGIPNTLDLIFGGLALLLVMEASRRVIGPSITIVASIFLIYAYFGPYMPGMLAHRPFPLSRIISYQFMTTEGIYGIPIGVSATFVFLFILFGSFMRKTGMGKFILDMAMSVAGGTAGGPAKVAVVGSGMMGMMSGSATANVVTTGSFTIPLMKSLGYSGVFAGAVESVASTGGQFMPPVMGAAAFIMAEFLAVSYVKIAMLAFIPACLYYFAVFVQVHLRAKKIGLKGVPKSELPRTWDVLKKKGYLLIPVFILIYFLLRAYSPMRAGFYSIVATIILGAFARGEDRFTLRSFLDACEDGARSALTVAIACACAGIVVGIVTMTGLGLKFAMLIITLSGGILFLTLFLTMIVCLLLGMGVPVTASYVILATMAVPALTKLGVLPIAAHLLICYFAVLADITPPVCIAAYAGAAIAEANPMRTGVAAFKLGIAGFIVPYVFAYDSALLGLGSVPHVMLLISTTVIGVILLGSAVEFHLLDRNKIHESAFLFTAAGCLIKPGLYTDLVGFGFLALTVILQAYRIRRRPNLESRAVETS